MLKPGQPEAAVVTEDSQLLSEVGFVRQGSAVVIAVYPEVDDYPLVVEVLVPAQPDAVVATELAELVAAVGLAQQETAAAVIVVHLVN